MQSAKVADVIILIHVLKAFWQNLNYAEVKDVRLIYLHCE